MCHSRPERGSPNLFSFQYHPTYVVHTHPIPLQAVFALHNGVAPGARLIFTDMGMASGFPDQLAVPPNSFADIFAQSYTAGARVHSDSWGGRTTYTYDRDSVLVDAFTWQHPDFVSVVAAGNDGAFQCTCRCSVHARSWLDLYTVLTVTTCIVHAHNPQRCRAGSGPPGQHREPRQLQKRNRSGRCTLLK